MERYSGLITAGAITFWIWFLPLLLIILLMVSGIVILIQRRSSMGGDGMDYPRRAEGIQRYIEKDDDSHREKKSKFFKEEDRKFLEENLEEFTRRIGKKRSYYIPAFYSRDRFNIGSAMGGLLWLGYRGMIRELLLAFTGLFLLDMIFWNAGMDVNIGPAIGGVLGMTGNYLYFKSLQRRITDGKGDMQGALGVFLALCLSGVYLMLWYIGSTTI